MNAITSSQNGIVAIPDSPEQRIFAYNNETTTAVYDGYKAKSESPELARSIHEFPASSTLNGADDASNRIQILEDPIVSTLPDTALQVSNANVILDQHPPAAPSSELQELIVPSGVLRRSPFVDHSAPRAATNGGAFRLNDLRKQPANPAEPIRTTETGKGSGQAQQDFPLTQSPIRVNVPGRLPLPALSDSPRRENHFGESLIPGIRKELSLGPRLPCKHETVLQSPGEEPPWVNHPSAEHVSGVPIPRDAADRQKARESEVEIDTFTHLAGSNVQASDEMGLQIDKGGPSHHPVPALLDETLGHKEGNAAATGLAETEPQQARPHTNAPNSSEDATRPITWWTTHNRIEGRVTTLQDTVANKIVKQQFSNHRDWKAQNGAEVISIEETEDESFATRPRPAKRRATENPDIWTVPSDTDQDASSRMIKHSNRSSVQRNDQRTPVSRKEKFTTTREQKRQSVEKVVQPSIDHERLAEQQRKEQDKRDRTNARRRERTAERRAQEARLTEEEGARVAMRVKDQQHNEGTKAVDMRKNTRAKIVRSKAPSVHASAHKRKGETGALSPARSEIQASTRKKTSHADRSTEEQVPKRTKNNEEKACDLKSEGNSKKVKIVEEHGGEELEAPRKNADQEAEMAAREADAIARVERSVKPPSNNPAIKKRGSSVVSTGLKSDVVRKVEGPSEAQSRKSPTPGTRKDTVPKRRSMTPLFPSSNIIKPVRSALRSSESLARRSVSFNDDAIAIDSAIPKPAKPIPSQGNSKLGCNIQPPVKAAQPRPSDSQSSPSNRITRKRESDKAGDFRDRKPTVSRLVTPSRDPASKPKIQMKLNVIRDVKLKGRAVDPPPLPKPVKLVKDEVVISSDSERSVSTFYSDEDGRNQPVKAGPSSRKKPSSSKEWDKDVEAQNTTPTTSASRNSSISRSANTARTKVDFPVTVNASHDGSERDLREISMARSPAEYMSRAASTSSRSQSGTESHTASESGSQAASGSEEDSESEYGSDHGIDASNHLIVGLESKPAVRAVQNTRDKSPTRGNGHLTVESRSKVPQGRLTSSKSSSPTSEEIITDEEEENSAQQMEQQLQRDCRRSMEPQSTKQPALPSDRSINNEANFAKPLAAEPPKTRFPSLSALRSRAPMNTTTTSFTQPPNPTASKRPSQVQRSSSTSESDDGSSSSEDSDSDGKPVKQTSSGGNRMTKIIKRMLFF